MNRLKRSSVVVVRRAVGSSLAMCVLLLVSWYGESHGGATPQSPSPNAASIPQPKGLLYVLDTLDGWSSKVLAVEPVQGKVLRSYSAGYRADMALSPDGNRLYITSMYEHWRDKRNVDVLQIYDTSSGQLIKSLANRDARHSTIPVYPTSMEMSASGRYIYMVKVHNTVESTDVYVTAFDTDQDQFLPAHVSLFGCGATLLPTSVDLILDVACSNSAYVREIVLGNSEDAVTDRLFTSETVEPRSRWGAIFVSDRTVGLIDNGTCHFLIDRSSGKFRKVAASTNMGKSSGMQRALVQRERGDIYFATREGPHQNSFDWYNLVVRADLVTLAPRATTSTTLPFYSMTLSRDGNTLYIVSAEHSVVTVIDALSLQEIKQLSVGTKPIYAISGP